MIAKKFSQNFFFQIVSQAISFIASIFVARLGGAAIFGNIGLATSYQNLFRSLIVNASNNAHLKVYAEDKSHGIKTYMYYTFSLFIGADFLVFIWAFYNYITPNSSLNKLQSLLIFIFILQDFIAFPALIARTDQTAKLNIFKANIVNFIPFITINIFKIFAVFIGFKEIGIALAMLIASLAGTFYSIPIIKKSYRGKFDKKLLKKYFRYSLYIAAAGISQSLLMSYDKILLGFMKISPEMIGYYNAGNRLGVLFMLIGVNAGGIFLAIFSKNAVNKDTDSTLNYLKKYERYILIFFSPFLIGTIILGKDLLGIIFGQGFAIAYVVLSLSLIMGLLKILTIPLHNLLFANNKFKSFNILSVVYASLIIFLTTSIAIIDPFDDKLMSVAFGLFLAGLIEKVLFTIYVKTIEKRIRFSFYPAYILYFLMTYIISTNVINHLDLKSFASRLLITVVCIAISILGGSILGIYKRSDINLVFNLLHIN